MMKTADDGETYSPSRSSNATQHTALGDSSPQHMTFKRRRSSQQSAALVFDTDQNDIDSVQPSSVVGRSDSTVVSSGSASMGSSKRLKAASVRSKADDGGEDSKHQHNRASSEQFHGPHEIYSPHEQKQDQQPQHQQRQQIQQQEQHSTQNEMLDHETKQNMEAEMPWSQELHKSFVDAIFEVGMIHSSPSVIAEKMQTKPTNLTSERLKSHLQKFRQSRDKEKRKFMEEYESNLHTFRQMRSILFTDPGATRSMLGNQGKILGGKLPAFLTHIVLEEARSVRRSKMIAAATSSPEMMRQIPQQIKTFTTTDGSQCAFVPFPNLTEAETEGHLGASLTLVRGLIQNMGAFLLNQRSSDLSFHNAHAGQRPQQRQHQQHGRVPWPPSHSHSRSSLPLPLSLPPPSLQQRSQDSQSPRQAKRSGPSHLMRVSEHEHVESQERVAESSSIGGDGNSSSMTKGIDYRLTNRIKADASPVTGAVASSSPHGSAKTPRNSPQSLPWAADSSQQANAITKPLQMPGTSGNILHPSSLRETFVPPKTTHLLLDYHNHQKQPTLQPTQAGRVPDRSEQEAQGQTEVTKPDDEHHGLIGMQPHDSGLYHHPYLNQRQPHHTRRASTSSLPISTSMSMARYHAHNHQYPNLGNRLLSDALNVSMQQDASAGMLSSEHASQPYPRNHARRMSDVINAAGGRISMANNHDQNSRPLKRQESDEFPHLGQASYRQLDDAMQSLRGLSPPPNRDDSGSEASQNHEISPLTFRPMMLTHEGMPSLPASPRKHEDSGQSDDEK